MTNETVPGERNGEGRILDEREVIQIAQRAGLPREMWGSPETRMALARFASAASETEAIAGLRLQVEKKQALLTRVGNLLQEQTYTAAVIKCLSDDAMGRSPQTGAPK